MSTITAEPSSLSFEEASAFADQALANARANLTPPLPHAYEVWFNYVAGRDEELRTRLDHVRESGGAVDLSAISDLYEAHCVDKTSRREVQRICDRLSDGIDGILTQVDGELSSSHAYIGSLTKAQSEITLFSRSREVKEMARHIAQLTRAFSQSARENSEKLGEARAQVAELKAELKSLRHSASIDHLTQLWNRRRLDVALDASVAAAQNAGASLCFALCDIDRFKTLNDRFGHPVGDAVLKHFGQLLAQNIKGQDTAARFGGEEFAMIFPRTGLAGARQITEKIRQLFYGAKLVASRENEPLGPVSVSFGVTELRVDDSVETLVARADKLLYKAKQDGRNRVIAGH